MTADWGERVSYMVLEPGARVFTRNGDEVGTVKRVLADSSAGIFDGIVIDTRDGERFVDAPEVGDIYERAVMLALDFDQVGELSEPTPAPVAERIVPPDPPASGPLRS
jgi:hypothetical protein